MFSSIKTGITGALPDGRFYSHLTYGYRIRAAIRRWYNYSWVRDVVRVVVAQIDGWKEAR